MELVPIGVICSPYREAREAPSQGKLSDQEATIELFPAYIEGLKGIQRASHLIVLYWGHQADRKVLQSKTPWHEDVMGVFASRSPNRPNPIAFCVCELISVRDNLIRVKGLDALDGSPLLDVKIYAPEIDSYPEARSSGIKVCE